MRWLAVPCILMLAGCATVRRTARPRVTGDTVQLLASSTSVRVGSQIVLRTKYVGQGVDGLQWTLSYPSAVLVVGAVAQTSTTSAAKSLYCNTAKSRCLVAGLGTAPVVTGPVADYSVTFPTAGKYTFRIASAKGASAAASAIPVTPIQGVTVTVR